MTRFQVGDRVRFTARGLPVVGTVEKLNLKTARVQLDDGQIWLLSQRHLTAEDSPVPQVPESTPVQAGAGFQVGQHVRFGRPNGAQRKGKIVKINAKSVGIQAYADGKYWRVSPQLVTVIDYLRR